MGEVYLAEDRELGAKFVLKVLSEDLSRRQECIQQFRAEARVMANLKHPNIVRVFNTGHEEGIYYLIMDYVEGPDGKPFTLLDYLRSKGGKLSETKAGNLVTKICDALGYAHAFEGKSADGTEFKGIVHRDIKPSNILLDRDLNVKLSDFGLVKMLEQRPGATAIDQDLADIGTVITVIEDIGASGLESPVLKMGTQAYMSPEQRHGGTVDIRSDIYSLGIVIYQMLLGKIPRAFAKLPSQEDPGLSKQWDDIVAGCLKEKTDERFQSVHEIALLIRGKAGTRRIHSLGLWASVLLIVGLTVAGLVFFRDRSTPPRTRDVVEIADSTDSTNSAQEPPAEIITPPEIKITDIPDETVPDAPKLDKKRREGHNYTEKLSDTVNLEMVWVEPGEFLMGSRSGEDNEQPVHKVQITKGFWMGKHEVLQNQFAEFVHSAGYTTSVEKEGHTSVYKDGSWNEQNGLYWRNCLPGKDRPVVCVSWYDAEAFCRWLSKKTGTRYWLPTEAEWEYVCRAGEPADFCFGNSKSELYTYTNYCDISNTTGFPWQDKFQNDGYDETAPAGAYRANHWGIYDMHGNVWEWCSDLYGEDYYEHSPVDNPAGPVRGDCRVVRGGSWGSSTADCRSAHRSWGIPTEGSRHIGFRVVVDAAE